MLRLFTRFLITVAAATTCILVPGSSASANGLDQYSWNAPGLTVSSSSYRYSNMTGFVQAIVNSKDCGLTLDGNFGPVTTWGLAVMQNDILGYNNGGVMNPSMWYAFQNDSTEDEEPFVRLQYLGYSDGYGTWQYEYYGGGAGGAHLGFNPYSSQWLFSPTPFSNPTYLVPATTNLTIGSYGGCA